MTKRQRMLAAIEFTNPDKIPIYYHPSPAGLYVHGQKLVDLFESLPPDNYTGRWKTPILEKECLNENGEYEEIKVDLWGVKKRYRIYGIHGFTDEYPLEDYDNPKDWHCPKVISDDKVLFEETKKKNETLAKDYVLWGSWLSIFEIPCALRRMDDVLLDILSEEPRLFKLIDKLMEYNFKCIDSDSETSIDVVTIGDDWGIQTGPIINPKDFVKIFKPRYKELVEHIHKKGMKVMFHSCGNVGAIWKEIADLGIDIYWHQMNRYNEDEFIPFCKANKICVYIHPDRQYLVPLGSPKEIENAIMNYSEVYHKLDGGAIFYVEIENDAPFENIQAMIKAMHKYR